MKVLFKDEALPQTIPFSRLRTIFSLRDGIYTPIERIKVQYAKEKLELYFSHPDKNYQDLVASVDGLSPMPDDMTEHDFNVVISSYSVNTLSIFNKVKGNILADLKITDKSRFLSADEFEKKFPFVEVLGDRNLLYIAKDVNIISRSTILDARAGIVIIDSGTTLSPFSLISGTVYIGQGCHISNARISRETIIGNHCRVSGEVSSVLFNDYSSKSHDGYIGKTVVGSWVNLGAMTTTSNLKNNYSDITLMLPSTLQRCSNIELISTHNIKFGSLIGDFCKTAIGIMINCGTVIDTGCNILVSRPEKYIPPMCWADSTIKYDKERFIKDCSCILSRKGMILPDAFEDLVKII